MRAGQCEGHALDRADVLQVAIRQIATSKLASAYLRVANLISSDPGAAALKVETTKSNGVQSWDFAEASHQYHTHAFDPLAAGVVCSYRYVHAAVTTHKRRYSSSSASFRACRHVWHISTEDAD